VRRPSDEDYNEREELFGEYPALLTASDLRPPPSEAGQTETEDEVPKKKRRGFRLRRRRHAAREVETVAPAEPPEAQLSQPAVEERPVEHPVEVAPVEEARLEAATAEAAPVEAPPTRRQIRERRRRKRLLREPRIGSRIRAAREVGEWQAEAPSPADLATDEETTQELVLGPEVSEEPIAEEPARDESLQGGAEEPADEPQQRDERPRRWFRRRRVREDVDEPDEEPFPPESPLEADEPGPEEPPTRLADELPLIDDLETEEPELEEAEEDFIEKPKRERRRRARPRTLQAQRRYLRSRVRMVRWLGLLLIAAAVGSVAPQVLPRASDEDAPDEAVPVEAPPDQQVVAWIVHGDEGEAFITLLASGERRPLALAIPSNLTITVPGQSLGTLEEAAASGDQGLVQVALQNVLGVPIDAATTTDLGTFSGIVDAVGGVEVSDNVLDGEAAVAYLHPMQAIPLPDEPFLRWQDVLEGLMEAVAARPEAASSFAPEIRTGLTAALPEPPDMVALPVIDFGAGVIRVDREGLKELVRRRFVLTQGSDVIRLVVLNGVGTPGIGENVAKVLVPEGFLLVSSQNANTFNLKETRIIASSQEDVPAAERARELLGAGRVYLGNQPGLADVTVVVGRDFGGS
jgi:hypothetical protein